jgi:ABC-type transporter Mla MlaB component
MSLPAAAGLSEMSSEGDAPTMGWSEGWTRRVHGDTCDVLHLDGPLTPAELTDLCRRVNTLIGRARTPHGRRPTIICDITALDVCDLGVVDQLARLQLSARRAGGTLSFEPVGAALRSLLALVGLDELLADPGSGPGPSVERQRQAEQREQPGVEKDVEMRHPPL